MRFLGFTMLVVPLVGWFFFCAKDIGVKKTAVIFGAIIGGLAVLVGWYWLAFRFIG